jgi:CheY-like chemotaxis protein
MGDPTRIKQVLSNLISNAIKFTQVGEVTIATHVTQLDEKKVELQFHISDTGIGIDHDKLDSIFEFFIQEDSTITRKFGGTGLGLAISRSLAEQMEGTLVCSSVKGQGSTFTLTCKFDQGVEEKNLEIFAPPDFSTKTILVVEDNALNQFLVVTILEKTNAKLLLAANGFEAVDNAMKNNIDLVLMDLQMPEMDGIQATRIIKNDLKLQVPIVALTANGMQEEREKCREAGMVDFIQKPFKQEELLQKIQQLVG